MDQLHGALRFYTTTFDNFLLLSDFSKDFERSCNSFSLGHLIKTPTCYMGTNPSSIDHINTNMTSLFTSFTVETGISHQLKLIMSICKMTFARGIFTVVIRILIVNFLKRH